MARQESVETTSLEQLVKLRGACRAVATKKIRCIDLQDQENIEHSVYVLTSKLERLEVLDDAIQRQLPFENLEEDMEQADEVKSVIACKLSMLKRSVNVNLNSSFQSSSTALSSNERRFKLPKLSLESFNGELTKWNTFWDTFRVAVHENTELSDIEKFQYLRPRLLGPAKESISGLSLTAANYSKAIETIQKRFGRQQAIISAHMSAFMKLPFISNSDNVSLVRSFYDSLMSNVLSLESIGVPPSQYGKFLLPIILEKLPRDICLEITRNISEESFNFEQVANCILKEVEARERFISDKCSSLVPSKVVSSPTTASALVATSGNYSKGKRPKSFNCIYCQGGHVSSKCDVFADYQARMQYVKQNRLCFNCLSRSHALVNCLSTSKCSVCKRKHHTSLCRKQFSTQAETGRQAHNELPLNHSLAVNSQQVLQQESSSHHQLSLSSESPCYSTPNPTPTPPTHVQVGVSTTLLPTVKVSPDAINFSHTPNHVLLQTALGVASSREGANEKKRVRILFDKGAQRSFITNCLQRQLNVDIIQKEEVDVCTFGSCGSVKRICNVSQIFIQSLTNSQVIPLQVLSVDTICAPLKVNSEMVLFEYEHLRDLPLADPEILHNGTHEIDILIGSDQYWHFVTDEIIRGQSGPVAMGSKLGYLLSGAVSTHGGWDPSPVNMCLTSVLPSTSPRSLEDQVSAFWESETIGISLDDDNSSVLDFFESTLKYVPQESRYVVRLPWKPNLFSKLPDNKSLCQKRLSGLLNRLEKKPELFKQYHNIIEEQLANNIIEKVEDPNVSQGVIHYLPHRPVVRDTSSTTKTRIVYDGSAKGSQSALSLNDCLYPGPSLIKDLVHILLRFRMFPVALLGDIEKAFLQLSLADEDKDATRFLWINRETHEREVYRFCRVLFGLSPSPFLLNAVLQHHITGFLHECPQVAARMLASFYADDFVSGADTPQEASELAITARQILQKAGLNLRKWKSNVKDVEAHILKSVQQSSSDQATDILCNDSSLNVLGLPWDAVSDQLQISFDDAITKASQSPLTKRVVLKATASIFDPLGLMSPFVVVAKVLFQHVCSDKFEWDEPLPGEYQVLWTTWLAGLKALQDVKIPRCVFPTKHRLSDCEDIQLHAFSDASMKAYSCALYIRLAFNDHVYVSLLASKSRVAPLKPQTIPRLELMGSVISARLLNSVATALSSLNISQKCCWTDSMNVLYWLKREARLWKPFVQHRVAEIYNLTPPSTWRHCPGISNPADLPSRGVSGSELSGSQLWWTGPDWLKLDSSLWPKSILSDTIPAACTTEARKSTVVVAGTQVGQGPDLFQIMPFHKFSDWAKLVRVTAYVLRFVNVVCKRAHSGNHITLSERYSAEVALLKCLQRHYYFNELHSLQHGKLLSSSKVRQLDLFLDSDGLIRCGGRIQNADLAFHTTHPILLPRDHHITRLIVLHSHKLVMHNGVRETLVQVRGHYWIPQGRQVVKSILRKCTVCIRLEGKAFVPPQPPPLPEFRVKGSSAFDYVGLDFGGPLFTYPSDSENRGAMPGQKVYICLYTCAVTRCVHLELVENLSTECFLRCFRRFCSRRGVPSVVVSDNGRTFIKASKDLTRMFQIVGSKNVQEYAVDHKVKWIFNVEKGAWWGGYWERLIQSVKRCLKKVCGSARLSFDELSTIMCEVEAIINSRPLTYVSSELERSGPLCPSHFLSGVRLTALPPLPASHQLGTCSVPQSSRANLIRRLRYQEALRNHFWSRWKSEYLTSLREQHSLRNSQSPTPVHEGQVVLVHDGNTPRLSWKLGRIVRLITGRDHHIRAAEVRVVSKSKAALIKRPIQLLFPLEVD